MADPYDDAVTGYLNVAPLGPQPLPSRLDASLRQAVEVKPDFEAELRRASERTGVPMAAAQADPKTVSRDARVLSFDVTGMSMRNPATANFLAQPTNAKIAHDDVPALEAIETGFKNLVSLGKASGLNFASGMLGLAQGLNNTAIDIGRAAVGLPSQQVGVELGEKPVFGKGTAADRITSQARQNLAKGSDAAMPQTDNPWAAGVNSGIVSTFQNAPLVLGAVLTKNPALALGGMTGLSAGSAYGEAQDAGKDSLTSLRHAATQGAAEYLTEKLPMHQLIGDVAAKTGFFKTLAKNLALEMPGEQIATVIQDLDSQLTLHPEKSLGDYLRERPDAAISTAVATVVGTLANTTVAKAVDAMPTREARMAQAAVKNEAREAQAMTATAHGEALTRLDAASAASKVRERDPQTFEAFINAASQDTPISSVYVDPRVITEMLGDGNPQSLEENAALLQSIPGLLPKMEEALARGGDVEIPVGQFAAYVAGTPLAQSIIPHLKTDPAGMSMLEADAFMQSGGAEELKADVEQVVKAAEVKDEFTASKDRVQEAVLGQLTEANRFTPDVNKAYAELTGAFYANMAQRTGQTPEAMYAAHQMKIAAAGVAEGSLMELDQTQPVLGDDVQATEQGVLFPALPFQLPTEADGAQRIANVFGGYTPGALNYAKLNRDQVRTMNQLHDAKMFAQVEVPLRDLIVTQRTVNPDFADAAKKPKKGTMDLPAVYRVNGQYVLADGHHRATAALAAGKELIKARVYDVDAVVQPDGQLFQAQSGAPAGMADVRSPRPEYVQQVVSANFESGRVIGPQTVPIDTLSGGIVGAADDVARVKDLQEKIAAPEGYFERLIVDQDGNVVEGQHRLDALRAMGAKEVPIIRVQDDLANFPTRRVKDAINAAASTHSDHVNQIVGQLAEIYSEENGDMAEVRQWDAPRGFSKQWAAALDALDSAEENRSFEQADDLAQGQQAPRGSYNPNTNLITLLKNADLSTFLHESGHFYLETMARLAADPNAPADIQEDFATALKFMGQEGKTAAEWLATPLDDRREGHELFARGFEAYLMEGKSPSQELKGLFQRFRSWLLTIYQSVAGLRVELSDDVRGVFDRMLASQQQIERQGAARAFSPYYANKPEGATDQEWEAYQRQAAEGAGDAIDQLQARSIRDMKWLSGARDRTVRKLQREAAAKRKAVRAEVEAEVMAEPVNLARTFLKHGTIYGEEVEGPHKLHLPDLRDMYPGNAQYPGTGVDTKLLGTGKYGMVAEEGINPEQVAELFGYSSGDELVRDLISAENAKAKIDGITDQRMLERYGDLVDMDAVENAADEALHNAARLKFVATEAAMAQKAIGGKKINAEAARAFAADLINRSKIRDLLPSRYTRAETRAAEAARKLFAAGDQVGFATEKRNQMINGYAAKATYDAQDEVAKALRYFDRLQRPAARKAIDLEYRDQIDALLERFDLSKNVSLKALDKRKSLLRWVDHVKATTGLEPIIPEELLNEANRKHYKEMTIEELKGLTDSVRNIVHLGRLKNRLLTAKTMRDFKAAVDALSDSIAVNAIGAPRDMLESNQLGDKVEKAARAFLTSPRKFDSLGRRLDGHDDNGTFWELLIRPKNAASDREETMRNANNKALHAILTPLLADKFRQKVFIPEINASLSLEGRLAVALNWGNEINRKRIMDGDGWNEAQVQAILHALEPRHFKFVQDLWDYTNSFRPQIEAMMKRQDGVGADFVEPVPFQAVAADGSIMSMNGGYYHIEYDPDRSAKAAEFDAVKMLKQAILGSSRSYTRPGHRKARVDEVLGRPLKKTLSVGMQHLNDVIHDLAWSDYIIDAKRLLGNEQVADSIRVHAGPEVLRSLKSAVEAMEIGEANAQNGFEASINYLRSGSTIAGLGWNFMTSALQPFGVLNGAKRIGVRWMGVGLNRMIGDAATMQNAVAWVHALSPMMAERANGATLNRELYDLSRQVSSGARSDALKNVLGGEAGAKTDQALAAIQSTFFWTIGRMQMVADVPTWIGQYEKSMADHGDEEKAVAQADQAVMDSQGSGRIGDLSSIQRGGPLLKLWTNFYSYMNVVYNQLAESVERTQLKGDVPKLVADAMLVLILPTIFATTLKGFLRGDDWDELPGALAHDLLSSMFGMFVGVRDLAGAALDGNAAPAGISFLKTTKNFADQIQQGELDEGFFKALNAEAGILFHYPAGQVQKTAMGIKALAEGTTRNPLAPVTGPPPK